MWRLTLMPKYRNGSESVCCSLSHFVSLNGLAATPCIDISNFDL